MDLHHDRIVRYHNRYAERDAGILYILWSTATAATSPPASDETKPTYTRRHYLLQILPALHHRHHWNGLSKLGSGSAITRSPTNAEGGSQQVQILHRDLTPNSGSSSSTVRTIVSLIIHCPPVFLDENNTVKLRDFLPFKSIRTGEFREHLR